MKCGKKKKMEDMEQAPSAELNQSELSNDKRLDLGKDTFGSGIVLNEPQINSWVRVKLEGVTFSNKNLMYILLRLLGLTKQDMKCHSLKKEAKTYILYLRLKNCHTYIAIMN